MMCLEVIVDHRCYRLDFDTQAVISKSKAGSVQKKMHHGTNV